jgi:hypothetical protein
VLAPALVDEDEELVVPLVDLLADLPSWRNHHHHDLTEAPGDDLAPEG